MPDAVFTDISGKVRLIGSLTGATPGASDPQWTSLAVTSAQILALHTTPRTIVAAPGAGKLLVPLAGFIAYTEGTTPYTALEHMLAVVYVGEADGPSGPVPLGVSAGTLFQGGSAIGLFDHEVAWFVPTASAVDTALQVRAEGENPTLGNGTMTVYLQYSVVTL